MNKEGLFFPSASSTQTVVPNSGEGNKFKFIKSGVIAVFVLLNKVIQFVPSKT